MRKFSFLVVFLFISFLSSNAQDTIVVQTITYDSTGRDYVFDFPDIEGQSYEKILMQYSMRCKDALVSTGSDRNKGCGEWDFSCNTNIIDSTLVDSIKAVHPTHIVSGFKGNKFSYTKDTVYNYYRYTEHKVNISNVISEKKIIVGSGADSLKNTFNLTNKTGKSQYVFTANELTDLGFEAGDISGISLNILKGEGLIKLFKIRIKSISYSDFSNNKLEVEGFKEVFFSDVDLVLGENRFDFYQSFEWDGTSNILVEFSYTNSEDGENIVIEGTENANEVCRNSQNDDFFLQFSGIGKVYLQNTDYSSISDEITIAFWAYGDLDKLPANTSIFEGVDENNKRQVNCHFPWSNSKIYWDCGNVNNSYDRIDREASDMDIKGRWSYWAFTKDTKSGLMNIYKNGLPWHSGENKTKKIDIRKLVFGGSYNNNYPYYGFVDDFSIWNVKLPVQTIKSNMVNEITETDQYYDNLIAYFDADSKNDKLFLDKSKQKRNAIHSGLVARKYFQGKDIFKGLKKSKFRPNLTFFQGQYEKDIIDVFVLDSLVADSKLIYYYGLEGTEIKLLDSLNVFEAGKTTIVDGDTGELIEEIAVDADSTINISTLDYYEKYPGRFELLSFVTPYGINLDLGVDGKMWQFDVTDFTPVLKGRKRMTVEFGKYQEELDIRFLFITGTPPHNVNKVQQLWRPGTVRKFTDIRENKYFEPRKVEIDKNSTMFKLKAMITGHGQEGEFIAQDHFINIDGGAREYVWKVWKECADNPLYPQGGTWVYDRAGWCPGAPTDMKEIDITENIGSKDSVEIDYGILSAIGDSRYIVNWQMVSYGEPNFNVDAAIAEIKRPSKRMEFSRFNPICYDPIVVIQNTGKNVLTELKLKYYVKGGEQKEFDWAGELKFLEKEEITLPIDVTSFWIGDGSNIFVVELSNPNGSVDEYINNNKMESPFDLPDVIKEEFVLVFKSNSKPEENKLYLKDVDGNIIYKKTIIARNHTYKKEIKLEDGCYELEVYDSADDGLAYWAHPAQGKGNLYFKNTFNQIRIKTFNPDFGKFLKYSFVVGNINQVDGKIISEEIFDISPNPASSLIELKLNVDSSPGLIISITDIWGREYKKLDYSALKYGIARIDVTQLPKGLYMVTYRDNKGRSGTKKVVIQ